MVGFFDCGHYFLIFEVGFELSPAIFCFKIQLVDDFFVLFFEMFFLALKK